MIDREQVIKTLTEHKEKLLSTGFEDKRVIEALHFAIESIKVDLAYEEVSEDNRVRAKDRTLDSEDS